VKRRFTFEEGRDPMEEAVRSRLPWAVWKKSAVKTASQGIQDFENDVEPLPF
jgi:hypothetical protein